MLRLLGRPWAFRRVLGMAGGGGVRYLLRDEFTTDRAAGAVNGTAAEPGPGTRVVVDTGEYLSLASGEAVFSGGTDSTGDPALWEPGITRAPGAAALFRAYIPDTNLAGPFVGLATLQNSAGITAGYGLRLNGWTGASANFTGVEANGNLSTLGYVQPNAYYNICVITRAAGVLYLIQGGTTNALWTLARVSSIGNTATLYPFVQTLLRVCQVAFVRCADLTQVYPGLSSTYGQATASSAVPSTGETLTGKADSVITFDWTPASSETFSLYFRRVDDDNTFRIDCDQAAGTIKLYRRQAGSDTELDAGKTQSWTAGTLRHVQVSLHGSRILTFINGVSKHNVVDTYNQTATGTKAVGFATGADFAIWPKGSEGEWASLQSFFPDNDLNPVENVLFIGGSITAGGSASGGNGFPQQVNAWLMSTYYEKKYYDTTQSFGGRPSWIQLINMENIVAAEPDLIFIDYAVNDTELYGKGSLPTQSTGAAEALIRVLRTKLPNAVITTGIYTWPDNYSYMTATKRAARDLWLELASRYDLHLGSNLAANIEAIEGADYDDTDVEKYFASNDVHPNDLGHTTIADGFEASLPDILPVLAQQWTAPLPERYISESEYFEADPIIRNGTDNDGETGTGWTDVGTARSSSTSDDTISWDGSYCSFGLDTNYGGGAGTLAWKLDDGSYTEINLAGVAVAVSFVTSFTPGEHTVTIKVISGTVTINRFLAV